MVDDHGVQLDIRIGVVCKWEKSAARSIRTQVKIKAETLGIRRIGINGLVDTGARTVFRRVAHHRLAARHDLLLLTPGKLI